jgi:hypothetical protein
VKPELFLLIFTVIFAVFVWCCHWCLNAISASEDAKLKLISLAENGIQKREVAELLSKSRVSIGDVKRLSEKFSIERREKDRRANFFEKNKLIDDFVSEHHRMSAVARQSSKAAIMTGETDNRKWSEWHHNPFNAIAEVATPKDAQKMAEAILEIMSWSEVNGKTFLDDLLREVSDATGIVFEYIQGDRSASYRAAYDKLASIKNPKGQE